MSIEETVYFGMPAYRWGKDGRPYMYRPGDAKSQARAQELAKADAPAKKIPIRVEPDPIGEKPVEKAVEKIVNYRSPKAKKKAKKK